MRLIEWTEIQGDWTGTLFGFRVVEIFSLGYALGVTFELPWIYEGKRVPDLPDFPIEDAEKAKAECEKYARLFMRRFNNGIAKSKTPKKVITRGNK